MSREAHIRASLAMKVMETFPGIIRDALISDAAFRAEYGLTIDAVISFGSSGLAFQRSKLMGAVRGAFRARRKQSVVVDQSGQSWTISLDKSEKPKRILLTCGQRCIVSVPLALLSPSKAVRLDVFRHEADRVGLPIADRRKWEAILSERAPDDHELGMIQDDVNATPLAVQGTINESLATGSISLPRVIPHSALYYERLIGACVEGQNFDAYVASGLRELLQALAAWDPLRAFRQALLLDWQPTIRLLVAAHAPIQAQIASVWNELADKGDMLSRAAAIETGLGIAQSNATLREPLGHLIEAFVTASPVAKVDPYELLSSLITLVYGEISHTRVLAAKPPYWRRLAAIAHAAMMARCIAQESGDVTQFLEWASTVRSQVFLLQCLVDLREEPLWVAELIQPDQLKNELGGRVWFAAQANAAFVELCGWKPVLLDEAPGSLRLQLNLPHCCLPGPLEGGSRPAMDIPDDHLAAMRADLAQPTPSAEAFSTLANAALLFRIPNDVVDLAADALDRTNYYLKRGDSQPLIPLLLGLATVAAATRNHRLADALVTLLRNYRRFYPAEIGVDAAFEVGMVACASRSVLTDWCVCIGNLMTDLSFQQLTREEAVLLHSSVLLLCHLVPELWASCGQAEAALQSFVCR